MHWKYWLPGRKSKGQWWILNLNSQPFLAPGTFPNRILHHKQICVWSSLNPQTQNTKRTNPPIEKTHVPPTEIWPPQKIHPYHPNFSYISNPLLKTTHVPSHVPEMDKFIHFQFVQFFFKISRPNFQVAAKPRNAFLWLLRSPVLAPKVACPVVQTNDQRDPTGSWPTTLSAPAKANVEAWIWTYTLEGNPGNKKWWSQVFTVGENTVVLLFKSCCGGGKTLYAAEMESIRYIYTNTATSSLCEILV